MGHVQKVASPLSSSWLLLHVLLLSSLCRHGALQLSYHIIIWLTLNRANATQFSEFLLHSDAHEPEPLTADERYQLSWESGTER